MSLQYEVFKFFNHWAWRLVDVRRSDKTVLAKSLTKHATQKACVAEILHIKGNNAPVVILEKDSP